MNNRALHAAASAVKRRRSKSLSVCAAVVSSLVVLTACGGDSDGLGDAANGKIPELGGDASGPSLPGSGSVPTLPKPTLPPKPGSTPGKWEGMQSQIKDFPHQAPPLARLNVADCRSYTAALADYGNHPSGGMIESKGTVEFPGANDCTGWRTGDEDSIRDIKAGHMEYQIGYNCSPVYENLDQIGDRLTDYQKNVSEAKPGTTYSPLYRLPEFDKGFAFSVHRDGTNGSSGVTATFLTDQGLCQVGFTAKRWAPNDNGKGLKYVGLDEAETFKEFGLIVNAMLGG
ncbi:hypothetical protein [Yinghuangia sp. YIM S10712]|uniref:hypothetical protein n=1 Tax=Yinghuangia sp. YIM S10712 TaxID=3436930 RepID=UPI003F52B6D4